MNMDKPSKPILRKATARTYYLRISAEWMTDWKRFPSAVLAAAEKAARGVLASHACQPKARVKPPLSGCGGTATEKY
jgi:hypothetical protein